MYDVRDEVWFKYAESIVPKEICDIEDLRKAFNAGWKARKTAEYEAIVSIGRDD